MGWVCVFFRRRCATHTQHTTHNTQHTTHNNQKNPKPKSLRTPNDWDSLLHWQDVLTWRNHIYNIVIGAFNRLSEVAPQLHQMGYRDKAWSVNKLGRAAALHGCPEVAIAAINGLYGYSAMEVQVRRAFLLTFGFSLVGFQV